MSRASGGSRGGALALIPSAGRTRGGPLRRLMPEGLRDLVEDLEDRLDRLPTRLNEYGFDPFGYEPSAVKALLVPMAWVYRSYFRVETHGVENVPEGRVLLIGNHAGNTFAWDGAMVAMAMLLEGNPPRQVRAMAEYYLPRIPWFNVFMHRAGSVVGRPETCKQLLDKGEAVMVFPEGERGFLKPYSKRYQLQRFGLGFMRLALETDTPIVPVGIVGGEEQSPGLARPAWLGKLVGAPAVPITLTFPWLGLLGFLPLPVKYRISFGEPLRFDGDASEDDAAVEEKVEVVKDAIRRLVDEGLAARHGWFA